MSKPTPGPWTPHPRFSDGAEVRSIAQVAWCGAASAYGESGNQTIDAAEACANARLIAAAPDLLGMLEMMAAQHFCGCRHPACKRCKDDDDCADVIAKAKGETVTMTYSLRGIAPPDLVECSRCHVLKRRDAVCGACNQVGKGTP